MSPPLRLRQIQVWRLAIPLRLKFEHAAAARAVADPVIVQLSAATPYAHYTGFGETLAREYVTGETAETVARDIECLLAPHLVTFSAEGFTEALELLDALPYDEQGRLITAARTAIELALLDLAGQVFRRRPADLAGWLDLPGFGPPGCLATARYSGHVVGRGGLAARLALAAQRAFGLRDFKLKVATPGWEQRLERASGQLGRALTNGRATLRVDANGGWRFDEARAALPLLERAHVCALEQPLARADDARLPELAKATTIPLMVDESLLTEADATRLIRAGGVSLFNLRIAKHGGLLPTLRLARRALAAGLDVQLGCLVGETSVLSAAGIAALELCPQVRFIEGAFGRWLLRDDVATPSVAFGRGGRIHARTQCGLGVKVAEAALTRLAAAPPVTIKL